MQHYPVVFLITDQVPYAGGMGTAKTMYNLLQGYPNNRLYILGQPGDYPADALPGMQIRVRLHLIQLKSWPRLNRLLGNTVKWLNGWLRRLLPLPELPRHLPKPHCILVATTKPPQIMMAARYGKQLQVPVLPYFLDYWMDIPDLTWGGQSLHPVIRQMLQRAPGWMVISQRLGEKMAALYGLALPPLLVMHNPSMDVQPPKGPHPGGRLHIAYAGSLWDMHFDALQAVAAAIALLQQQGMDARLTIYTSEAQYRYRQQWFAQSGTHYGGFLAPVPLQQALRSADMLLVTASFSPAQRHFSECSLQTKVTEYMGSGVPILSVGPDYGECNRFFNDWNCALTLNTNVPKVIAEKLADTCMHPSLLGQYSARAQQLASTRFSHGYAHRACLEWIEKAVKQT